jgi:hypothetical protein
MKSHALLLLVLGILLASHQDSPAQPGSTKVYWMVTTTVPLGNLPKYHELAAKELIPLKEKHGYHFVCGWQTIIGDIEEVIYVAEFDNFEAYQKARVSFMNSAEWKILSVKIDAISTGIRTRMLAAVPYITTN